MKTGWIFLLIGLLSSWQLWTKYSTIPNRMGGMLAPKEPRQQALYINAPIFKKKNYKIIALARFNMDALVIRSKPYSLDREAQLAPVDLTLGWGRMSDPTVLSQFTFDQKNRFYYWHTNHYPIPRAEIESRSANMHMVPANDEIEKQLQSVQAGQIIKIKGYLIEARAEDGWRWKSSLTRTDSGPYACELVWVESLDIQK